MSDAAASVSGTPWIVSAPSGAGKTSLTRALVDRLRKGGIAAAISVSYTTRLPRPGEEGGRHYHFVDDDAFAAMVRRDEFLEHAEVFGKRYGSGRAETEQLLAEGCELFFDIDWQGARQLRGRLPGVRSVFVLPPSMETLERRLRDRGQDGSAAVARRMQAARDEISHYREYDALVVNDDFDMALVELAALVLAQRLRTPAQAVRHAALLRDLLD